ncbi:cral trio domain-containing protein [Diplodia corticola]|uniref:Cral trio domain-containing protein n=1 Tax=Diplodia corticola TaxID=236234 RepID=A0A1J9RDA0_9PEZI|nr:cral trio domain-containing protein [Diplodia corticola]OJD38074.1 cral trio domain-containing protein [Diplodia corticola]
MFPRPLSIRATSTCFRPFAPTVSPRASAFCASAVLHASPASRCPAPHSHLCFRKTLASARTAYSQASPVAGSARARVPSRPAVAQSGLGYTLCVVALGIAAGSVLVVTTEPGDSKAQNIHHPPENTADPEDPAVDMSNDKSAQMPPGRPGNLTAEQEVKLKELWNALAKITGMPFDELAGNGDAESVNGTTGTTGTTPAASIAESESGGKGDKKKSKRLHIFKHKKGDKDGEKAKDQSSSSSAPAGGEVDVGNLSLEDDKHGMTKAFQTALAETTPEELRASLWSMVKHDNPDALLLRFLRARKWDVQAALIMLISALRWRATEMHVDDDIIRKGEGHAFEQAKSADAAAKKEGEDFMTQLRIGKSFVHGVDKEGRPMCYVRVRLHKPGEQSEQSLERFTVYLIETTRMMLSPPVDTAVIVFDMSEFALANMDYTPVKFMIKCFEANYPESLGAVMVYKAPWVFQGIWSIIRGWLDPVVASKVHFVKTADELSEFVPRSNIPTEMGGDEQWTYSYVEPKEGENAAMKDAAAQDQLQRERDDVVANYERATATWVRGSSEDEAQCKREREELTEKLRENYWKMDPYLRARTLYDRNGDLGPTGKLDFYKK